MSAYQTKNLTAALLYQTHDPLNFKHLATTLNLILEPAKIKFRVIHERPGQAAVLSCRKLHVAISANDAAHASEHLKTALQAPINSTVEHSLATKIKSHRRNIEIAVGAGPLPHSLDKGDLGDDSLLPLLGQMVVNHILNMNPADAIYWNDFGKFMTPREFLAMINSPSSAQDTATPPEPPHNGGNFETEPLSAVAPESISRPTPNVLRREIIKENETTKPDVSSDPSHLSPSFIIGEMSEDEAQPRSGLLGKIHAHFDAIVAGPKAAFVVSAATMLVAPIIGILLLIYNVSGGARIRQTALFACVAAAVTLAAELTENKAANATASATAIQSSTNQL